MKKLALLLLGASALLLGFRPALADPQDSGIAAPAKRPRIREVRVSSDFLLEPDDSGAQAETQAEPFVAVNPERESHVVAVYQEGRFEDGGARALTYAVSTNGGRTWSEGLLPGLTQATGDQFARASDPWVAFGPGGRVYYSSLAFGGGSNGIFVSASADGGATWDDPMVVQHTTAAFVDKPAMTVDTRGDSPWQGRVYVTWMSTTGNAAQSLLVSYSADEGASFSLPVQLASQGINNGAIPVVGPGGVVHLVWFHMEGQQASIRAVRSEDGGATWSAPVEVARLSLADVPYLRTGAILPAVAVDGRDGTLYVVWQDGRLTGAFVPQIFLSASTDGGATWSEPEIVSDGPLNAPNFTPSIAVNGDGVVAIAYTSLRNDPSRSGLLDQYIAFSKDGGRTFRRSQRLSTLSTYAGSLATAEGYFQGDYQGLAAGAKTFYRTWIAVLYPSRADRRVFQPDAFTLGVRP